MIKAKTLAGEHLALALAIVVALFGCSKKKLVDETKRDVECSTTQPSEVRRLAEQISNLNRVLDQLLRQMEGRSPVQQRAGDVRTPEARFAADVKPLQELQDPLPASTAEQPTPQIAAQGTPTLDLVSENLAKVTRIAKQGQELADLLRPPGRSSGLPSDPIGAGSSEAALSSAGGELLQPSTAPSNTAPVQALDPSATPEMKSPQAMAGSSCCDLVPNPVLKGRLGRLVVVFPEGAKAGGTRIDVHQAGAPDVIAGGWGNQKVELLPGTYAVVVSGKRVEGVTLQSGNDTTVKVGMLRVTAGGGTRIDVLDPDTKQTLTGGWGNQQIGLPLGQVSVRVAGQTQTVTIEDGKITDF